MKALGRGFSGAPFKTFTIRIRDATQPNLGVFSSEVSHERCLFIELVLQEPVFSFSS